MRFYVVDEPCYALFSAEDKWQAFDFYDEHVSELFTGEKWKDERKTEMTDEFFEIFREFISNLEEISERVTVLLNSTTVSEETLKPIGRRESIREIGLAKEQPTLLAIDASLV